MTAPTLKSDQGQAPAPKAQLSAETRKLQTACYSYLSGLVQNNLEDMTASQPYAYLVPAGTNNAAIAKRQRQLENVSNVVLRGVTPGNLMAFAGPVSSMTADLLVAAFKNAQSKSLKGVIVVFVGDQADQQRVQAAVDPSGVEFRFVAM